MGLSRTLGGDPGLAVAPPDAVEGGATPPTATSAESPAARITREQLDVVWRLLRRLGLSVADADDVAQEVFVTVVDKVDRIEAGKEKAFVLGVAVRIATRRRHALGRSAQRAVPIEAEELLSASPLADAMVEHQEELALLDRVLASMDDELRTVFVLYELEELTMADIAVATSLPPGTVASRLRRARESFRAAVKRARERMR